MSTCNLQRVWNFLDVLYDNNNKPWFDAHKDEYKLALADFQSFCEQLILGISKFDKSVVGLTVKDCTYRIYRDLRFSLDKTPYKTHMGVYVCPQGKKSGNAGYYVHIEPHSESMLVAGLYMPTPDVLKSVREEIMCNGKNFDTIIKSCKHFDLDWTSALKKVPNGWNKGDEYSDYYRLKDFDVVQLITKEQITSSDFLDFVLNEFKKTVELNELLNKCVLYAKENF